MLQNTRQFFSHAPSLAIGFLFAPSSLLLGIWVAALPAIKVRLGFSDASLGLSLLLAPLGSLLAAGIANKLLHRFRSGPVLLVLTVAVCMVFFLQVMAWNRWVFWLALFANGFVGLFCGIILNAVADKMEKQYNRKLLSTCHALYSIGGGLSAGFAAILYAFRVPLLWQIGLMSFLILVILLIISKSILAHQYPIQSESNSGQPPMAIISLAMVCFVTFMGEGCVADWSAIYLKETLHSSDALAGLGYAAFAFMMAIGRLNGDQWVGSTTAKKLTVGGQLLAAIGFALVCVVQSQVFTLVGFACIGLGFSCIVPLLCRAAANMPGISAGMGIAVVSSGGLVGFLVGPSLIGLIAEKMNLAIGLSLVMVLCLVAGWVASRSKLL
jgi:MFS family permease